MAVLLVACRPPATDGAGAPPATDPPTPEADVAATESDSLRLWLEVPARVRAGEPVRIAFRARNVTDGPLDLYLRGRTIAFDLIVADAEGAVAWRRLEDQVIPAILRIETLAAGATLELGHSWDQRSNAGEAVAPGDYTVRGELLTEGGSLSTPSARLRIAPG